MQIARVECAKRRRECDLSGARTTLCGDRACRALEMQASTGDFGSGELEAEHWRLFSPTLVRGAIWGAGS